MEPSYVLCSTPAAFHHMAYRLWGDPDNPRTVVCVHGLNRNGRDFDDLARAMSGHCRVVCPDVAGRGHSDWLPAAEHYQVPQYVADMTVLLAALGTEQVDWVGTSMGGMIGMAVAAMPNTPIRRLVLNDVGPFIPKAALERIAGYAGLDPVFDDFEAAIDHFAEIYAPFGPLTGAQWRHLTESSVRQDGEGKWVMRRDPAIGAAFADPEALTDVDLWPIWDAIRAPVLALRGVESDLLTAATAEEMTRRGPKARVLAFDGVGHAPALMSDDQIAPIRDFLLADG